MSTARVTPPEPALTLRGDEAELYGRHHAPLVRAVTRQVNACPALIEDACQRAWMILMRHQPNRGPTLFAWLRTVAVREAYALSRGQRRTVALADLTPADGEEPPVLASDDNGLDKTLEARRALRALAALPDRQRRYLTLHTAGYAYHEIARLNGATYTNVNKHLVRARAALRDQRAA